MKRIFARARAHSDAHRSASDGHGQQRQLRLYELHAQRIEQLHPPGCFARFDTRVKPRICSRHTVHHRYSHTTASSADSTHDDFGYLDQIGRVRFSELDLGRKQKAKLANS